MKQNTIAILFGGPSSEHEVSCASGVRVMKGLEKLGYDILPVLIDRNGEWTFSPEMIKEKADLAFVAMHGEYGEDGTVQRILRDHDIPFTGSGVLSSALGMHKGSFSKLMEAHNILVPEYIELDKLRTAEYAHDANNLPVVVKPADRGSSLGVSIVHEAEKIYAALEHAFSFSRLALVQKYIPGKELTCAVLDDERGNSFALPVVEVVPSSKFYDYEAKYSNDDTAYHIPARLSREDADAAQETALLVHKAVGAHDMSRTDMILGEDGKIYVLEINTIPGMTEHSLLPKAAEYYGLSFEQLLQKIIDSAKYRYNLE